MRTIRRLIHSEVFAAVVFVTLAFLALFAFFDFVDQLSAIGRPNMPGYQVPQAALYVLLLVPSHLYELLPITVLIGTIYVMTRLAQSSEFTILRTSGLGPWRALRMLLSAGFTFALLTFVIGDYLTPWADRTAQLLKARYQGNLTVGQTGAWLREREAYAQYGVNVGSLAPDGSMRNVRIFEFDNQSALVSMTQAPVARFTIDEAWLLENAERTEFNAPGAALSRVERIKLPLFRWPTGISAEMISAAVLKPDRMSAVDLFQYIRHLKANAQTAERYEIEFWKKVFYPLSCLVMVIMALPFAYLHFRSEGISVYVFGGVMAGISFFFLNNMFGYIGELQHWIPWLTAAAPGMIFMLISLTAFGWLVLRR
ncbi:LPS export ABC transporter permease LptG [Rhodoferax sp. BAB1]|uniref:LPS export ABC transporter permease LptG n=1 Tax=Rhodoferax sp. BAB1 TaxID=2741720 RepID=UPI0015762C3C|nr:LPS export ABC transporter permease LptG [Rhodoferax sp. BAB1]QKO21789.1 LPS export ABC transporter permease LptG [Rhodoferax sp. BAB1]